MGNPRIVSSMEELVGDTPAVRIRRLVGDEDAELYVKLERFNPSGSVKDRAAFHMIRQAELDGRLKPGGTLIEVTSGNTGIGLALIAAIKGYRIILIMSDNMSLERVNLLKAYGAEVILYPADERLEGGLRRANELLAVTPNSLMPNQFENDANPDAHRKSTALEILEQTDGRLDAFVATAGTGGTVTGTGQALKEALPDLQVFVVETKNSPVLSGGEPGAHKIPGTSPSFIPAVLQLDVIDEILPIDDEVAWQTARALAAREGLLVGPSSGAAVWGGIQVARRLGKGKRVLCIAPDTGERYLSLGLYDEPSDAMAEAEGQEALF